MTSFYIESLSGLIYSLKELKFIIKSKFLKEIDINENIEESLELISNNLKQNNKIKNLGLFFISDLTDENINKFKTNINRFYDELKIVISNDFSKLETCDSIMLVVQKGKASRKDLLEYSQKFTLLNKPIYGWIFIKNYRI